MPPTKRQQLGRRISRPPISDAPGAAIARPRAPEKDDRIEFKPTVPASSLICERLHGPDSGACSRRADHWHHFVPQETLRRYVLDWTPRDRDKVLRRLLHDRRNLAPMCAQGHMAGEPRQPRFLATLQPFSRAEVPAQAWEFAAELGLTHVLERHYPEYAA